MKRFVRNDNKKKYYKVVINYLNGYKKVIKKLQNTLKILQKSYKIVISISLSLLGSYLPDTRGRMYSVLPYIIMYV